jgi:hypothetical protein
VGKKRTFEQIKNYIIASKKKPNMINLQKLFFMGSIVSLTFLAACKDDGTTPGINSGTTVSNCIIKSSVQSDGLTTNYTFEAGKLVKVTETDAEGTDEYIYTYTGADVTEINMDATKYKIMYAAGKVSKVEVYEGTELENFANVTVNSSGVPTKIDIYDKDDMGVEQLNESFTYTYSGGNCTKLVDSLDTDDNGVLDYSFTYEFSSYDDKTNPFYLLPTYMTDLEDPTQFSKNNLTVSKITAGTDITNIVGTYTYNTDDVPTKAVISFDGSPETINYTYTCD